MPFVKAAHTLSEHRDGIVNAVGLRLSNARLEAMNSTVRLIPHDRAASAASTPCSR